MILDFKEYMKVCYEHLLSTQSDQQVYYQKVDNLELERAKNKIKHVLEEALNNKIITDEEFNAMDPEDKTTSKFYCNFKIHKQHAPMTAPPPRPIISGSGSITENLGVFVENQIREISTQHSTYLLDTPHFLRVVQKINKGPRLPLNAMLVTSDIIGAYQNIPQEDGIDCLFEVLEERKNKEVPSEFISKLMELIQPCNLFEFNQDLWKQIIGVAMGIHPAPSYANIYLGRRIDEQIRVLGLKYGKDGKSAWLILKHFLDDIFKIFIGTTKEPHELFQDMNKIHPTLKFTLNHTTPQGEAASDRCECKYQESIQFLDTSLSIEDGRIEVDLYKKDTDRNQYLLRESCHPSGVTASIPFSLSLRIIRICTKNENRDKRLSELKQVLTAKGYPEQLIE